MFATAPQSGASVGAAEEDIEFSTVSSGGEDEASEADAQRFDKRGHARRQPVLHRLRVRAQARKHLSRRVAVVEVDILVNERLEELLSHVSAQFLRNCTKDSLSKESANSAENGGANPLENEPMNC